MSLRALVSKHQRIDLTQFEGYIEKLGLREDHFLHIVEEPNRAVGPWNEWRGGLIFDLGETSSHGTRVIATARLMVAAPRLLAELKKCYAIIDEFINGSWLHHTVLENKDYMDLMMRLGVFDDEEE